MLRLKKSCDELGLLVMDEFTDMWEQPKNVDDYAQFFKDNWESDPRGNAFYSVVVD